MFVGRPCGFSFKERRFRRVIFGFAWCLGSRPYYVAVVIPFSLEVVFHYGNSASNRDWRKAGFGW